MNKDTLKGILLVGIGASSYGVVATFVKKGLDDGYDISELVFAQAFVGTFAVTMLNLISRKMSVAQTGFSPTKKDKMKLMLGGIPLALTSTFYYLSLLYVPVSVCIVMLMQSVWMSVVIDYFVNKVKPTPRKVCAIFVVLIGTVFATNILNDDVSFDWRGFAFGLLAALSYSFTFLVTNNIAKGYRPLVRTMYMLFGLLIMVSLIWGSSLVVSFDPSILWSWGLIIAFFGTILPPLLFTKGMPLIGVGLGGIIASIELPVSVVVAYLLLHETVSLMQWMGIALILLAVALMNLSFKKTVS